MSLNTDAMIEALKRQGRLPADLARAMSVSRATVSRWLSGKGEPEGVERLKALADELGLTLAEIANEQDVAATVIEKALLQGARLLNEEQQEALLAIVTTMGRGR